MLSTDREEFEVQLKALCAGFDKPLGDRLQAYWNGLAKMSLIEFARCVEFALGEHGPEKLPTTKQIWMIRNSLKRAPRRSVTRRGDLNEPPPNHSRWRLRVDALFLRYLAQRRMVESFRGDINLAARRRACRALWEFCEQHEREFGSAPDDLRARFKLAMERIPDVSDDDVWLATELERQRLEDQWPVGA